MAYKTLAIPRFPDMTLRDAIDLGIRRLEEDGYVEVRFDATSVHTGAPRSVDEDWRLGFLVVDPSHDAAGV